MSQAAVVLVACGLATPVALAEAPSMRGPQPGSSRRPPLGVAQAPDHLAASRGSAVAGAGPFAGALNFYRTVISPVDGDRCEMAPTCSLYALQAYREHGPLLGFLLTADRLLHEADEKPRVRTYVERGETMHVDPVWANTYWLPRWMR